jgi:hypothetical protein
MWCRWAASSGRCAKRISSVRLGVAAAAAGTGSSFMHGHNGSAPIKVPAKTAPSQAIPPATSHRTHFGRPISSGSVHGTVNPCCAAAAAVQTAKGRLGDWLAGTGAVGICRTVCAGLPDSLPCQTDHHVPTPRGAVPGEVAAGPLEPSAPRYSRKMLVTFDGFSVCTPTEGPLAPERVPLCVVDTLGGNITKAECANRDGPPLRLRRRSTLNLKET